MSVDQPWKQNSPFSVEDALDAFEDLDLHYGEILEHETALSLVGLRRPDYSTTFDDMKAFEMARLARFEKFRERLLIQRNIDLVAVPGVGYRLIMPQEQVAAAMADTKAGIRARLSKGILRTRHVNTDKLDDRGRQERADALNRLETYRHLMRKKPNDDW